MTARLAPTDAVLRRAIEAASSFEDASQRLGLSKTCVRTHADRLGVRTRWRSAQERMPDDRRLKAMFRDARKQGGVKGLMRRLGVGEITVLEQAKRLGIDPQYEVRAGLPDDETLRRELLACERFSDLARKWGVYPHTIRNQARRLGIPSPS